MRRLIKIRNFPVEIIHDSSGMYMAKVAALVGCHTQAKTLPVLYQRTEEAIQLCLEVAREGDSAPAL